MEKKWIEKFHHTEIKLNIFENLPICVNHILDLKDMAGLKH